MVQSKKKQPNNKAKPNYLETLTPEQIILVLTQLLQTNPEIKIAFDELAQSFLISITSAEIAEEIYSSLDEIDMEDVLNRSGRQSDGYYKYPDEILGDDIEEILDPFVRRITNYIHQNLPQQANALCKGVLKGLYDFEKLSGSELLNELVDDLESIAQAEIIPLWKKISYIEDSKSIDNFIHKELQDWNL